MLLRLLIAVTFLMPAMVFSQAGSGSVYPDNFAGGFEKRPAGFQFSDLVDKSRTYDYAELGGRPLRLYTWYPSATPDNARLMTVGRYVEISRGDFHDSGDTNLVLGKLPVERALSAEQMTEISKLTTNAFENAPPAKGRFPLIVLGQGLYFENPITHFALCEYLAGHGFVVVTCPLTGTNSRMVMLTVRDMESIVRDLEFVLEQSLNQPYVDAEHIGVIGFDMGGMAAQVCQMRNSEVDAVMTMDAAVIFQHYSGLPANHPSFDLQRMTAPWLHVTQAEFLEPYRQHLGESVWGRVSDDRYLMLFSGVQHVNFTSYGLLNVPAPLMTYWEENALPNIPVYEAVARTGLTFMDAYLKDNQQECQRLKDEADSQTAGSLFTLERIEKLPPGLTLDQFVSLLIRGDVEEAVAQARRYTESNPTKPFCPESAVNDIGYRFLYSLNRPQIALEIFKLNVDMYPQSGNAYDSYAEGLAALGRVEDAIENYTRSLELSPENQHAKQMIELLKNSRTE